MVDIFKGKSEWQFEDLAHDMLSKNMITESFIQAMFTDNMFTEAIKILCIAVKENKSNLIFILFQYEYDKNLNSLYIILASICSVHQHNREDNNQVVCRLIEYGMNIFELYPDDQKLNLLHLSGHGNNTVIIKYIFNIVKEKYPEKLDEYLNGRDIEQNTPLIYAIKNNSEEAARLFLEIGANIDLYDKQMRSPIWLACNGGYMSIVNLLLEYGADINQCSISGKSPHFMALVNKSFEIATIISDRGGIRCGPRIPLKKNINLDNLYRRDEDIIRWVEQSLDSIETYENPDKIWNDIAVIVLDPSNDQIMINRYISNYISKYRDPLHSGYTWNLTCNKIASIAITGVEMYKKIDLTQ